jgi:hypothetical protein
MLHRRQAPVVNAYYLHPLLHAGLDTPRAETSDPPASLTGPPWQQRVLPELHKCLSTLCMTDLDEWRRGELLYTQVTRSRVL